MASDLIERARAKAIDLLEHHHATAGWLMQELADALAAQAAEIERLRKALIDTGNNLGATLGPRVTTEFLMGVPEEARLVLERLTLRFLNAENALADRARRCVVLATEKAAAEARADALAARVAELEAALRQIEEWEPATQEVTLAYQMADLARTALHPKAPAPAGEGGDL